MDLGPENEVQAQLDSQKLQKGPRLSRNDAKWDSVKDAIHQIYMTENKTLPETMQLIEERHSFKASERKWKMKMKEWKFEKYLSDQDKRLIVAKAEKRARDGKGTVFYHGAAEITTERIDNFKRRRVSKIEVASPSAETPAYISYHTPKEENYVSAVIEDVRSIEDKVSSLRFTVETDNSDLKDPFTERTHPVLDNALFNIATMCPQLQLPPFTEKDLLEIIRNSESAGAAMARAIENDYSGDVGNVVLTYLDAIDQIVQVKGQASLGICQLLCGLAEVASFRSISMDHTKSIYRQIITNMASQEESAEATQESKPESVLKIVAMRELGRTLLRNKEDSEAESIFCDAYENFLKLGYPAYAADCQLLQALALQDIGEYDKALPLLYSVFVYKLEHAQTSLEIVEVVLSLDISHDSDETLAHDSRWAKVFFRLHDLIEIARTDNVYLMSSAKVIKAVILIADALCSVNEFDNANSILQLALEKTNEWAIDNDAKYNKALCNCTYAKLLVRQGNHSKAAPHLILALNTLATLEYTNGNEKRLAFSASLTRSYVVLMTTARLSRSQITNAITTIETSLIELNGQIFQEALRLVVPQSPEIITFNKGDWFQEESEVRLTAAALQRQDDVTLNKLAGSEEGSEVRTTTTRSYKYGVTYSESVITGVSLSEFFVP